VSSVGATFEGRVSRFSGIVERATRTMLTEIEVDNPEGKLKPGMYANVTLVLKESNDAKVVPPQALYGGENRRVLAVGSNGMIEERSVTIGLQTPTKVEVLSGLETGDLVIVGSRSGLVPGQKVSAQVRAVAANETAAK
jgi:RND family efflux transporter MFP subunit